MIKQSEIAAELYKRRQARNSLQDYISYCNHSFVHSSFSTAVCKALDKFIADCLAGIRPVLILQAAPQHGKSEMVSRQLPTYLLGKFPDWRIAAASYSSTLADSMSLDVRRNLVSPEHLALFPAPEEKRKYSINRNGEFSSPNGKGGYIGDGVGGGFTGKSADCLCAGTLIETTIGQICIEELQFASSSCKVLSYSNGEILYENIEAFAVRKGCGIWRLTTERGRVLESTGDHKVFTKRGYTEASKLAKGDVLLSAVRKRKNIKRSGLQKTKIEILLSFLRRCGKNANTLLQRLQNRNSARKLWELLHGLFENSPSFSKIKQSLYSNSCNLSNVSKPIYFGKSQGRKIFNVLREDLCGQITRIADDGKKQSKMERWGYSASATAPFCKRLQNSKARSFTSGWLFLCSLLKKRNTFGSPSYKRESIRQCLIKFSDIMRTMSQRCTPSNGWKVEEDRVVKVERICDEALVYDIQVNKSHNFFANGILVHNCFIIDDPIKNSQEALSPTIKEAHWNWYQSTSKTRMSANSGQIIMATSWAEDDLSARIMNLHRGDSRLTVLKFPAINSPDEAGYNPDLPLGALVPELHPIEQLLEFKAELSDYWWAAMYQQTPKSLGGNIFKESSINYYLPKDLPAKFDKMIISWDCTFKDTDGTDFVVGQAWGKKGANCYLLDQIRKRLSFTDTVLNVILLRDRWKATREILIEDKANGPAVIDVLKNRVSGIIPIEPDGSKIARAHAVTSFWEAGNIYLPHPDVAPWINEFVSELTAFPAGAHDDQVDAMTQALRRLYPSFSGLNISQAAINKMLCRG